MHKVHTRMTGLHLLLTGEARPPTRRYAYPRRHLWGDPGQSEGSVHPRPRAIFSHVFRWM